jgi:hypothetical protein
MFTLRVPASFDDTIQFLLKAYAQPLVSIYGSDMSDWVAERDFIIRVATSAVQEPHWPKWFLALPMPQSSGKLAEGSGNIKGKYAAFRDGKVIATDTEPYLVMEKAVMHQWDSLVNFDVDYEEEAIALRENLDNVVKAVSGIVLYRLK